jgi:hypothetical protein
LRAGSDFPTRRGEAAVTASAQERAFRVFLRRVWKRDVAPLLRERQPERRRRTARAGGKLAGATGLAVDSLFHLKGRPFTRFMLTMGASVGAMLPDIWDWQWFRAAGAAAQKLTEQRVRRAAGELPEAEALELFGLAPSADRAELKRVWRAASKRWHPDKAPDAASRDEHRLRFVAYQAAYQRLSEAYEAGRLPAGQARRRGER